MSVMCGLQQVCHPGRLALKSVLKAGTFRNRDRRVRDTGVFVAGVFDEQQDEDIVLVLTGIHAAAQFVATSLFCSLCNDLFRSVSIKYPQAIKKAFDFS